MTSWAYRVAPDGGVTRMAIAEAEASLVRADAFYWLHIDGNDPGCLSWLSDESGLPPTAVEALRAVETRPRATGLDGGVLVNLRGVNEAPDADTDDLVSIRLWAQAGRVITMSYRPLLALPDLCALVEAQRLLDPGDLIAALADVMTARLDPVISDLGDVLDVLEDDVLAQERTDLRERLGRVRRTAINLRRYVSPQREALTRLATEDFTFFDASDRLKLVEAGHRVVRMVEELDAVRERAAILADQLTDLRAEATAERTLVLSVVSSIFLPLTVLTGLLGMNVEGIPFHAERWAFGAVVLLCVAIAYALLAWLRRRGWF
jgi:zinc transporter